MRLPVIVVLGVIGLAVPEGISVGRDHDAAIQEAGLPRLTPFQTKRTERLLRDRLACLGCHQVGGEGGQIGPSLDGLADRAEPAYVLGMIQDPGRTLPGTLMPRQPMPNREARRLASYLLSRSAGAAPQSAVPAQAPPPIGPRERVDGAALYARYCAACHGEGGRGDGWNAPNLPVPPTAHADATLMSKRPDDTLYDGIAAGAFVLDGSPRMPAFGELLEPAQIRALVTYIRTLCDCQGPEWSRDSGEV